MTDDRPEYMKRNDAEARQLLEGVDITLLAALRMAAKDMPQVNAALDAIRTLAKTNPLASDKLRLATILDAIHAKRAEQPLALPAVLTLGIQRTERSRDGETRERHDDQPEHG